jgi:hypothetical protein
MDDRTHPVLKTTPEWKRAFRGSRSQAGATFFGRDLPRPLAASLVELLGYRDSRHPQRVRHLRLPQP